MPLIIKKQLVVMYVLYTKVCWWRNVHITLRAWTEHLL